MAVLPGKELLIGHHAKEATRQRAKRSIEYFAAHTEKLHRPSAYPPIRLLRRLMRDHDRPQPLRRFSRHVAVRCGMAFGLHHHARAHELVVAGPDAVDGGLSPDRRS